MLSNNQIVETVILEDNLIQQNQGSLSTNAIGGGIFAFTSSYSNQPPVPDQLYLRHNQVLSNTTSTPDVPVLSVGGGLILGNIILKMDGDIIRGNQAPVGGGLYLDNTQASIANAVIADNQGAMGVFVDASEVHLSHLTVTQNQGAGIYIATSSYNDNSPSTLALTNAIIADQGAGITGTGQHTISVNSILWHNTPVTISDALSGSISMLHQYEGSPVFLADGYHIGPQSAAVDRGIATSVSMDIDSQPRLGRPDLGADEYIKVQFYLPLIWLSE
jgi:hypothetical protein